MTKKLLIAIVAALPLAGCVGYDGGGYGYNGSFDGPVSYDGYYDDYYGSIYDGYWGDGGLFYYRNSEHGHFRPDRSGHFRHDMNGGAGGPGGPGGPGAHGGPGGGFHGHGGQPGGQFHPMHGTFTPPAGGMAADMGTADRNHGPRICGVLMEPTQRLSAFSARSASA